MVGPSHGLFPERIRDMSLSPETFDPPEAGLVEANGLQEFHLLLVAERRDLRFELRHEDYFSSYLELTLAKAERKKVSMELAPILP